MQVPLSFALAKAIRKELEVKELEKRIEGITLNLNNMEEPLFHNHQVKPRRLHLSSSSSTNLKFHHIVQN